MRGLSCALVVSLLASACGAASVTVPVVPVDIATTPDPNAPPISAAQLGEALDALLARPYCEPDVCLDPFPIAHIRRWDGRGERVAVAGPGALAGVYDGERWDIAPLPERAAVIDVSIAPDGALFALASDVLYTRDGDAWREVARASGERTIWSAILARSGDEVWIGHTSGALSRFGPRGIEQPEAQPRSTGIARIWDANGVLAVEGPFGGAFLERGAWQVSVSEEHFDAFDNMSGCGSFGLAEQLFDEDVLYADEEADEPTIPETPPLPPGPDRTPAGWIAQLEDAHRARLGPWIEHPPGEIADVAREGVAWVAVGRSDDSGRLWARIGGELITSELPIASPTAVAFAGDRVFVGGTGELVSFDVHDVASATRVALPAGEAVNDLAVRGSDALLVTSRGVHALSGSTLTLLHQAPRPLRAIAADARRIVAVGEAGTIAVSIDGTWSAPNARSSVDLRALSLDGERAWAAGGAGTIVRIEGETATVLPRVTYEGLVDVRAQGDIVLALSSNGTILRTDGTTWSRRPRGMERSRAPLALLEWRPEDSGAWTPISEQLPIGLDEPGAVMPYRMLVSRLPSFRYGLREDDVGVAAIAENEVDYELEQTGMTCCDGEGSDGVTLADLAACTQEPSGCDLYDDPTFGVDAQGRRVLRTVELGPRDEEYCAPVRIDVVRIDGGVVERSSPVFDCARGRDESARAAWAWLAQPEQAAFVAWEHDNLNRSGEALYLHRTTASDALVFVSDNNRRSTMWFSVRRLRGAYIDEWAPIYHLSVSPDRRLTLIAAEIGSEHFLWLGSPRAASGEDAPRTRGDIASCESLVVTDADGQTNVRALPTARAAITGTLPAGTGFRARERHGRWIRLTAPVDGWVFRDNVACVE